MEVASSLVKQQEAIGPQAEKDALADTISSLEGVADLVAETHYALVEASGSCSVNADGEIVGGYTNLAVNFIPR